jgi:hypothetical protein
VRAAGEIRQHQPDSEQPITIMEWKTLTTQDLEGVMTRSEQDLSFVSLGSGTQDRVVPILENLIAEIRGMIATWSPNTLSADTTKIPPAFVGRALVIARWRLRTSFPGYEAEKAEIEEYERAEKFFQLVAEGKIRPEPAPDAVKNPVPSERPAGVQVVSGPGSRTGRGRMNGI